MSRRWNCMNGHSGNGVLPACPECGLPVSIQTVKDNEARATATAEAPVADETITGASPGATPNIPATTLVRDLIFGNADQPRAEPPWSRTLADGAAQKRNGEHDHPGNGTASSAVEAVAGPDETLQRPSAGDTAPRVPSALARPLPPALTPPALTPPSRAAVHPEVSAEETLQRPPQVESNPAAPSSTGVPADPPTVRAQVHPEASFLSPPTLCPEGVPTGVKEEGRATSPAPPNHGETLVRPSAMPASATRPAVPAAVSQSIPNGYEIQGILGRGGMGVVYKARQVGLNRLVALKMILSGAHASPEELARFRTEAEAVARLRHPNIVQIFDIGERDGRPFFALEFCEGGSLQQKLDGTPLDPRRAAALLATLAEAIDHAHKSGIIHRDLKPANILLTAEGAPKITDFGLAKRIDDDQGHTGTEAVLGTPTYMAPEQAHGKTRDVGPRADVYALGAILYDLLTGRPPFRGATALDTLQMVQTAEPIPPARLQPGVPADLQTICLKCLEKDPVRRYSGADALAYDLRAFLEFRPIAARPATTLERTWKWARRKPTLAALVALAILTPLLVTGISVGFSLHLAHLNSQISEQNGKLGRANDTLEEQKDQLKVQTAQLQKQTDDLEAGRIKLNKTLTGLREALAGEKEAQKDSQTTFLDALTATGDLLNLARVELRKPGSEGIRRILLRRAVAMCRRFTARPGQYPVARLRAARAYRLSGDLEAQLGDTQASIQSYDEAIGLYEGLIHDGARSALANVDYLAELLDARVQLWGVLGRTNSPRAAELLQNTLKRIENLDESTQVRHEYLRPRALLVGNRGLLHQLRGENEAARADYDQAVGWLERLGNRNDCQLERARLLVHRASLAIVTGENRASARKDCRTAIELLGKLGDPLEDPLIASELGRAHSVSAALAAAAGEMESAGRSYQQAVDLLQKLHDRAPQVADYTHLLAVARGELGSHLLRMKNRNARAELDASLAALRDLTQRFPNVPSYPFDLGRISTSEGVALVGAGDLGGAVHSFESAAASFEGLLKSQQDRPDIRMALLGVYHNLIYCRDRQARQALRRQSAKAAARYVSDLVELRRKYEQNLPADTASTPWLTRAKRFWQRLVVRQELIQTLRSLASALQAEKDHEGMARAVADLKPLVHPSWPEGVEVARTLIYASGLAGKDRALGQAERVRLAREYGKRALGWLEPLAQRGLPGLGELLDGNEFATLSEMYPDEMKQLRQQWQRASAGGSGTQDLPGR